MEKQKNMLNLNKVLREKNISNKELAERMSVSPQYISDVVNGRRNITVEQLSKFAEAIGVQPVELLYGAEELMKKYQQTTCPYCGNPIRLEKSC